MWLQAGLLAHEIVAQVEHLPSGDKLLENIPDNFFGAYVFRNGLDFALSQRGGNDNICWKTDLFTEMPVKGRCGEEPEKYTWSEGVFKQL